MNAKQPRIARRRRDGGVVLIAVLWIAILIAFVGGAMAMLGRVDSRRVDISARQSAAEALVDAAFNIAALRVVSGEIDPTELLRGGQSLAIELDGGRADVVMTRELERVDLNSADLAELTAMFAAAGAELDSAARHAAAVVDFRDPDDLRQLNGAESGDYRAAGLAHGPRNGPFLDVSELGWVYGLDPAIVAAATPRVTVHTLRGARPVRHRLPDDPVFDMALEPGGGRSILARREAVRMSISAETGDGTRAGATAVIVANLDALGEIIVLEWRRR